MKSTNKGSARQTTTPAKQSADSVSELTTNRLSVYLRCLSALEDAGVRTISSQSLAEQFHLNAAQIRKDLAYFGEFGVRGVGYYVRDLKRHLRQILARSQAARRDHGRRQPRPALADYPGFRQEGFRDCRALRHAEGEGRPAARGGVPIYDIHDLKKVSKREGIRIAVIAAGAVRAARPRPGRRRRIKAVLNLRPAPCRCRRT